MLTAGTLRELVTIKRPTGQVPLPDGGFETIYTTILETFASVKQEMPGADVIAQQENLSGVMIVKIRYRPTEIKVGDIIEWRGFALTAMQPQVDFLRRWITIRSLSAIETTER